MDIVLSEFVSYIVFAVCTGCKQSAAMSFKRSYYTSGSRLRAKKRKLSCDHQSDEGDDGLTGTEVSLTIFHNV